MDGTETNSSAAGPGGAQGSVTHILPVLLWPEAFHLGEREEGRRETGVE